MSRLLLCALTLLGVACDPGAATSPARPSPAAPARLDPPLPSPSDFTGEYDFEAVVSLDPPTPQGAETFVVRGAEQLRAVQACLGAQDPLRELTLAEGQTLLVLARPGSDSAPPQLLALETQAGQTRVRYALPGAARGAMQRGPYAARLVEGLSERVEFQLVE